MFDFLKPYFYFYSKSKPIRKDKVWELLSPYEYFPGNEINLLLADGAVQVIMGLKKDEFIYVRDYILKLSEKNKKRLGVDLNAKIQKQRRGT